MAITATAVTTDPAVSSESELVYVCRPDAGAERRAATGQLLDRLPHAVSTVAVRQVILDALGPHAVCPRCEGVGQLVRIDPYAESALRADTRAALLAGKLNDESTYPHITRCDCDRGSRRVSHEDLHQHLLATSGERWCTTRSQVLDWLWDPFDPLAVSLAFAPSRRIPGVEWVFARDLLGAGLCTPAGEGDVHVEPFPSPGNDLLLTLDSLTGSAVFLLDGLDVAAFLSRTYQRFPQRARVDVDDALTRVFAGNSHP
jgi:Streptomyces sporulation and cell division protein, SsgA